MPKLQHPLRRGLERLSSVLSLCARAEPWVCQSLAEGHSSVPVNHNNALKTSGRFPARFGPRVLKKLGGAGRCSALIGREGCRSVRSEEMVQLEHIDGQCRIVYPVVYFNRALVCKRVGEEPCRESLLRDWALAYCSEHDGSRNRSETCSVVKWSPCPKQKTYSIRRENRGTRRSSRLSATLADDLGDGNGNAKRRFDGHGSRDEHYKCIFNGI